MHLNPAEYVILKFGGLQKTARLIGRDRTAIWQWKRMGKVPGPAQRIILEKASELRLDITPQDLILGRTIEQAPAVCPQENRPNPDPSSEGDEHL